MGAHDCIRSWHLIHFAPVAEDISTPENSFVFSFLPTFNPNVIFGDGMVRVRYHALTKFDPNDSG